MFIPIGTENIEGERPIANWVLIAVTVVASLATAGQLLELAPTYGAGRSIVGLFTAPFLHAGVAHLLGNMFFLWLFGNVLCSRFGALRFIFGYVAFAVASGLVHMLLADRVGVGASGAIMGLVGFYLACFPLTRIVVLVPWFGQTRVRGFWLILFWFASDLYGALDGSPGIAYAAHIGGFLAGLGLGLAALRLDWVTLDPDDLRSLPEILGSARRGAPRPAREPAPADRAPARPIAVTRPALRAPVAPRPRPSGGDAEAFVVHRCACGWSLELPRVFAAEVTTCERCGAALTPPSFVQEA